MGDFVNGALGKETDTSTPDYQKLYAQQNAAAKEAAKWSTLTNRVDQSTPYGSQQWTLRPGADINNPKPGDWQLSTSLNSTQQGLLDQDNALKKILGGLANSAASSNAQLGTAYDWSSAGSAPDYSKLNSYTTDLAGTRQKAADSVYNELTKRYDDRFTRDEDALRNRLANQGLQEGSEAWNNSMKDFQDNKSDQYASAANQAYTAGREEMNSGVSNLVKSLMTQQTGYTSALDNVIKQRTAPLDEIMALRSGTGATNPSFSSFSTVQQPQTGDLLGAYNSGYATEQQANAAKNKQTADTNQQIAKIIASFFGGG